MIVWGLAFGATSVTLQLWLLQVSGRAAQLATSVSVSVFNLSLAVGAAVGGIAIDATGTGVSALVVAVVLLLTAVLTAFIRQPGSDRPRRRPTSRSGRSRRRQTSRVRPVAPHCGQGVAAGFRTCRESSVARALGPAHMGEGHVYFHS